MHSSEWVSRPTSKGHETCVGVSWQCQQWEIISKPQPPNWIVIHTYFGNISSRAASISCLCPNPCQASPSLIWPEPSSTVPTSTHLFCQTCTKLTPDPPSDLAAHFDIVDVYFLMLVIYTCAISHPTSLTCGGGQYVDINGVLQDETQLSAAAYTVLYPCSIKLVSESYFIPHLVAKLVLCMQQLNASLIPRPGSKATVCACQ